MNVAGVICGPAETGVELVLLEMDGSAERELDRRAIAYPHALRVALTRLESGHEAGGAAFVSLHGELGRALGSALRAARVQLSGALAAAGCRGYLLPANTLPGVLLGDLGLAGEAAPGEGRLPVVPLSYEAGATPLDCARTAAALLGLAPGPANPAQPASNGQSDFAGLLTEGRNPRTLDLDRLPTLDVLRLINAEDARVAPAVAVELARIAEAVDRVAERMQAGGRLIYIGAGTSGRMGVLDASEVPPTFGLSPEWVLARIAGGAKAITQTVEESEDDAAAGAAEIAALNVGPRDSVVGIAASGRTPYVLAALRAARERGALTVSLACNRPAPVEELADVAIAPLVGPEAVSGSTRMKAGTAQKMVLNMLSTGVMVRLGKTFSNLMVDMRASNLKLRARALRMVAVATGQPEAAAAEALAACDGEVKTAIVTLLANVTPAEARRRLAESQGRVRAALEPAA